MNEKNMELMKRADARKEERLRVHQRTDAREEKRLQVQQIMARAKEDKIMLMETSGLSEVQREYIHRHKMEILESRRRK
jgi:hypothetical protein